MSKANSDKSKCFCFYFVFVCLLFFFFFCLLRNPWYLNKEEAINWERYGSMLEKGY